METHDEDVKPTIHSDDVVNVQSGIKPKHSRYEDVWPADVHAAFMEAIVLYPPMGKRRLKYYRVSTSTDDNERSPHSAGVRSFGRCQLIQAYILEKTGKNRSRKQVSSHLQRLKRIHKDNPAMHALFSEASQPFSDDRTAAHVKIRPTISQAILPNLSPGASPPDHSAVTHNSQNMATSLDSPSTFSCNSDLSSSASGVPRKLEPSAIFYGHPSLMLSQESFSLQDYQTGALHHSNDPLFQYHEPSLFKDAISGTFQASPHFNTPTFSMSTHRFVSKRPMISRQPDLAPPSYQSRTAYPHGFQPAHRINSHDSANYPSLDTGSYYFLVSPDDEVLYTPPHSFHSDGRLLSQVLECDWAWPQDSDVSFSPFVAPLPRRNASNEIRLQYPLSMYQFGPLCSERRLGSSSSESDPGSMLSKGISYPTFPSTTSLFETMSTRAPISEHEYLAAPLIKPTPLYPLSYIHSDDTGLLSEYQTTSLHDYFPTQTLCASSQQ